MNASSRCAAAGAMPHTSNPSCWARALTSSALTRRSCYSPRVRGKAAVVLLAVLWLANPTDPYVATLREYLTADPNAALTRLLNMDAVSVSIGAHALPGYGD